MDLTTNQKTVAKLNQSKKNTSHPFTMGIALILILLFPQIVFAEKKISKLARLEKKKNISKPKIKFYSHSKKIEPEKPKHKFSTSTYLKKKEPEQPRITNIERVYESKDYIVKIRARNFKQGELMLVRLQANGQVNGLESLKEYNLFWMKKKVEMFVLGNDYMGFIPIHPELTPGIYDLEIKTLQKTDTYKVCPIQIEPNKFKETKVVENLKLPKRFSPKSNGKSAIKFILECEKLKRTAFLSNSNPLFTQNFNLPAKIKKITSNFYARRNYFTKKGKPHGGIDIRGNTGDPIHAIQDGKIVLSRPMFFEGIFTVIDHGSKIFSLYMHQSETLVHEGDIVKRGQVIGKIGSTGMSTGPHLHLGLKVDNVLVNPMSVIHLKIF